MLVCNKNCNKPITKGEVINLINQTFASNEGLFVGAVMYITNSVYQANFSQSGLGTNSFSNWALANGENGTDNWTGKFPIAIDPDDPDFNTANNTGGSKTLSIRIDNLPDHSHTVNITNHTHDVEVPAHSHNASTSNALSTAVTTTNSGAGTYTVSGSVELRRKTLNLDIAGGTDVEVVVAASESLDDPADLDTVSLDNGQVVIPNHSHTSNTAHNHTVTVDTKTADTVTSTAAGSQSFNTTSTGGEQDCKIINPYIVVIPIQKIS